MIWPVATCILSTALPEAALKWIHGLGGPGLILHGIADNTPFTSAPPGSIEILVMMLATHCGAAHVRAAACSILRHLFRSQTAGIPLAHIVTVVPKRESDAQKYWK